MQNGAALDSRGESNPEPKGGPVALAAFVRLQIALAAAVSVRPNPHGLPGIPALQKLVDGLAAVALLGCVAGVLIGAAQWALGSRSNNYSHASDGKSKVLYGLLGAFVVGAGAALINFFYSSGTAVK
jgi:NhaP-type Na+/H+ or K+/H+ antiporter